MEILFCHSELVSESYRSARKGRGVDAFLFVLVFKFSHKDKMADKIFYKYKSCSGSAKVSSSSYARLLDCIKNKYLYLTRPEDLNDPMDCKVFDNFHASADDMQKWLDSEKRNPITKDITVPVLRKISKQYDFQKEMRQNSERERQHLHIFSLTEDYDMSPMWERYAENYTGVCLGYRTQQVNPPYQTYFLEIDSSEELPIVGGGYQINDKRYLHLMKVSYDYVKRIDYKVFCSWNSDERQKIMQAFLHKNKDLWEYENESRVIVFDIANRYMGTIDVLAHYPDETLAEVWFGHNIEDEKKDEITELLKQSYSNFSNIKIGVV